MVGFTADFHKVAQNLIESAGVEITYKSVSEGVYDPNTLSVSNTETPETIKAFLTRLTSQEEKDPNLVNKSASVFLIANNSLTAAPSDRD